MSRALWVVQGLLAALFLFAGGLVGPALLSLVVGLLAAFVAGGRRGWLPRA